MARANWEWIKIDVLLPGHPKLAGLSPAARWTLVELWCHCGQYHTDGWVREAVWNKTGTRTHRDAIVKAELADPAPMGGYIMHDFTGPNGHQRSKEEIDELSAKRAEAGRKGGRGGSRKVSDG